MVRLVMVLAIAWAAAAEAGEFNKKLNIGDPAPAWEKLPGVDGKLHGLADLHDKEVVVVVFTCNSCPVATDYEDRLIAFTKKHAAPEGKVAVVAINVNRIDEDKLPKMKERAEAKGFPFSYLYDESQQIARAYGAVFTPEFFVLDKQRRVAYMGGMDDNSYADKVKNTYLEPAVLAALRGTKPDKAETPPVGCMIRYAREPRTRQTQE